MELVAHIQLPDGLETFSAPTPLWDPKSFSMFKEMNQEVKNYQGEAVSQNLHSALTTAKAPRTRGGRFPGRVGPPARQPGRPSGDAHLGLTLHARLPSRPRLPERPHAHRLLQRDSGRPAPAGIARARALLLRDAPRGKPWWPGRLSASPRRESSSHPGGVWRSLPPRSGWVVRGSEVAAGVGGAPGEAPPPKAPPPRPQRRGTLGADARMEA